MQTEWVIYSNRVYDSQDKELEWECSIGTHIESLGSEMGLEKEASYLT